MTSIVLAGNPNCGKTTLFNALTKENQRIGNWPGVTVEKKTGHFNIGDASFEITDLPGIYSLSAEHAESQDGQIAGDALLNLSYDLLINVVDASHLERHLYLTTQLLELGKPVIVALSMMDLALKQGIKIDVAALAFQLKCPVLVIHAQKKSGLDALIESLQKPVLSATPITLHLPENIRLELDRLKADFMKQFSETRAAYHALRVSENNEKEHFDIFLANARYEKIHDMVREVQKKHSDKAEHLTARLDKIVLHRFWAIPVFLSMMYLMFWFAIHVGGAFQDFFDLSTRAVFVEGTAHVMQGLHFPEWFIALVANGVGMGINTTLTFIPVMAGMYFFLSLLESSGYMARAAFVVDRLMRLLGLPGKSFVPMIVGFGCNVPAVMAARTLDSEKDRLLTVMMSPFMSCSARLAIYAVFVAAFFPSSGQNVVFFLYITGILMAVFTGFLLRKTCLKGCSSPLILELPAYHCPSWKRLYRETRYRLKYFISRAARMIIPVSIVLSGFDHLNLADGQTVLSKAGEWVTPLFSPMGLSNDNWPATVGLLTGMMAKEVVVGSLNSLYAQAAHFSHFTGSFDFWGSIQAAFLSIPEHLAELGQDFLNPVPVNELDDISGSIYGVMAEKFDGRAGALAYLLFILLYIPCVSTMAAIRQEAGRQLMWFSIVWSFLIAYSASTVFYQLARFTWHPWQSTGWIVCMFSILCLFTASLKKVNIKTGGRHASANS